MSCLQVVACLPLPWRIPQEACMASRLMAGSERPVAIRRGIVAHTDSSPADPRNSTTRAGRRAGQGEAGQTSVVRVGHRPGGEA